MHEPVPRHRRKAGSGPPANALIAWIGTDPYLRDAAATASYRRWMALPMPSNSRSAGAAVVACFALACCAVLGITAIISHGRATAQHKIGTSSLFAVTPSPEAALTLPAEGSGMTPAPTGIAPMFAERATPAPMPAYPARQIHKPSNSGKPADQVETVATGKASDSGKPGKPNKPGDTQTLLADIKQGDPATPADQHIPHSDKPADPAVSGNQDRPGSPAHQGDLAALTVPVTHRGNKTSESTPTGQIGGADTQDDESTSSQRSR